VLELACAGLLDNLAFRSILARLERPSSAGQVHPIPASMQLEQGSGGIAPHFDLRDRHCPVSIPLVIVFGATARHFLEPTQDTYLMTRRPRSRKLVFPLLPFRRIVVVFQLFTLVPIVVYDRTCILMRGRCGGRRRRADIDGVV